MDSTTTTYTSGISLTGVLFIVFLILKLTHVIDWSWWWVTAPLWGGLALGLVILVIALLVTMIGSIIYLITRL